MDINEVAEHLSEVLFRTVRTHRHMPPAREWLKAHEETPHALPLILVVIAFYVPWFGWDGDACLAHQLLAGLIQAHLRIMGIIWAGVDV